MQVEMQDEKLVVWIENNRLKFNFHDQPSSTEELQSVLEKIDKWIICAGGPSISKYPKMYSTVGFEDKTVWRHKYCSLILERGTVCLKCIRLHRNFEESIARKCTRKKNCAK